MKVLLNFKCSDWCYVAAISFQLAGAILLLLTFCGKTGDRILKLYFPNSNFTNVKNGIVTLKKEKLQKCAQKIYQNRISFVYLAFGYILGVYGEMTTGNKLCVVLIIIVGSTILIIFEWIGALVVSKILYCEDKEKEYDEIKKKVDPDVSVVEF